jgi:small-conductance mechanosensitive channel
MPSFITHWQDWALSGGLLAGALLLGLLAHSLLFVTMKRLAVRTNSVLDDSILRHGRRRSRWVFPLLATMLVLPSTILPAWILGPIRHLVGLGLVLAVAWIVVLAVEVVADLLTARAHANALDSLTARKLATQVQVFRRIAIVIVAIVTVAIMLMTIPGVSQIGASLLASAGLAGLVVGMAMRPTLSNIVAGIQLALTQPIRVEDAVIVEGEWGWVEEITATYVVVRTWDWRRLVLPLSYFIERPFQNWTHKSSNLLGAVHLYVDYTVPLDELRAELRRIVESTDKWDGNVCVLQVTDTREHTIELRALADGRDAGTTWDLRCYIRERLIRFLQERYPQSLPRTRAELRPADAG